MNIIAIILDILILAVVAFFIVHSAKRGFMRTLIGFLGCFAVLVLSVVCSWMVSDFVYGYAIRPGIVSGIESSLKGSGVDGDNVSKIIDEAVDELPDYIVNMANANGLIDKLESEEKTEEIQAGINSAANVIADTVARPVITGLIQLVSMIILFIIGLFAVRIISRMLNSVFSGHLFGGLNSFLGGLVGIPKGLVFAVILTWTLGYLSLTGDNGFIGITEEAVSESYIFSIINAFNPLIK